MAEETAEQYLTVDEACALLGVKKATLYSYVSRGLLNSYKQGIRRQRLYRRAEIEGLLTVRPGDADEASDEANVGLPAADEWVGDR
jgi:excisionase family DNA binding protein